jgi:hypothetical protein
MPSKATIARRGAGVLLRVWRATLKIAFRIPPPGDRTRAPRAGELAAAALTGAGAAYLLDPASGKRRRQVLRERTAAVKAAVRR